MTDPYYTQESFDSIPRPRRMRHTEKYPAPGLMRCRSCRQVFPLDKFGRGATNCGECTRAYQLARYHDHKHERPWFANHIRRTYGITLDQYDALLAEQGGVCAICRGPSTGKNWHIDHDHITGKVRAILCNGCNVALGQMRNSPEILRAAADYLEKHR
jgi:hypothetical protein